MDLLIALAQIMEIESCIFIRHPRSVPVSGSPGEFNRTGSSLNLENVLLIRKLVISHFDI